MRPDLTLETFDLGATVGDLRIELVQSASSFREIVFAIVDLAPRCTLFLIDAFDLAAALRQFALERSSCLREWCVSRTCKSASNV